MDQAIQYPKLRWPIDVSHQTYDGQEIIVLQCPEGISAEPLALQGAVAPIIDCFRGALSIDSIVERFRNYELKREVVEGLVDLLDRHLFLATPRFFEAQARNRESFAKLNVREAALAGLSYAKEGAKLTADVDKMLAHAKIPVRSHDTLATLVAPHIDYRRGGICYGKTYEYLRDQPHDLYILIGTAHKYSELMFHLTAKDFLTPLGMLACDKFFVQQLANRHGAQRSFADEILHRREHSLELQTPFLRRLRHNAQIVPILVGSFYPILSSGKTPDDHGEYSSFVGALAECMQKATADGRRVCFIAGVDMAHVGQYFGDKEKLTPEFMAQIAERDAIYLDAIMRRDKKMLFSHIAEDNDARKICGFPSMYTVLDVLDRIGAKTRCELFDYRQAVDYKSDCAVTFAGMGIYHA